MSQRSKPWESQILSTNKILNGLKHSPGLKELWAPKVYACSQTEVFAFCRDLQFLDILHLVRFYPQEVSVVKLLDSRGSGKGGREGLKGRVVGAKSCMGENEQRFQPLPTSLKRIKLYREGLRGK